MAQAQSRQSKTSKINWKSIALPSEHGGWSLILEPIILALLLAPSLLGFLLALAMMLVFLVHQPAKIVLKAYRTNKHSERTVLARNVLLAYLISAIVFAVPVLIRSSLNFWLIIALIVPFALVQLSYDFRNQSRSLIAELTGAIALSGSISLIVLMGNWEVGRALLLWVVIALRAVSSILYVRTFFRKQRQQVTSIWANYLVHILILVFVIILCFLHLLPMLTIVPFVLLLLRAIHGLQSDENLKPQIIGIREVIIGIIMIVALSAGFILHI